MEGWGEERGEEEEEVGGWCGPLSCSRVYPPPPTTSAAASEPVEATPAPPVGRCLESLHFGAVLATRWAVELPLILVCGQRPLGPFVRVLGKLNAALLPLCPRQ